MTERRRKYARHKRTRPGAPPGQLVVDHSAAQGRLAALCLRSDGLHEGADLPDKGTDTRLAWINVEGLGDADLLARVAQRFDLHPLAMEDVVSAGQRPKVETYDSHVFVVLRMPHARNDGLDTEQVSLFLGQDFVVTFQERAGDVFDPVRARLRNPQGRMRERGADYLAYALIDAVTDGYFPVLESLGDRLEALETEVVAAPDPGHMQDIHALKHALMTARGALWPLRELLGTMLRDDTPQVGPETLVFLRDCYDHCNQLIETVEIYREVTSGLVDLHLASQANRANEVMQVLTLIATIFIPLTFIAGVYGMNFDPDAGPLSMPELRHPWGYPIVMGAMLAMGLGLTWWFRRRGWLGGSRRKRR